MDQSHDTQAVPTQQPVQVPAPVQPPVKKGWIISGIIAGALVILGGSGWWLATSAQDAYVKAAAVYEQNLKDAFTFYKDVEDTEDRVDTVKDKFDSALASRPKEPNFIGIPLPAPGATKEHIEEISTSFTTLRDAFVDFHAFNGFADKSLILLDGLEQDPLIDIHNNEAVFNQAAEDMRALEGPDSIADFRRQKADVLAAIATQVGKAEAAIAVIDNAGYMAAEDEIKKLQPHVNANTVVDELKVLYRPFYDDLSAAYDDTARILDIEG